VTVPDSLYPHDVERSALEILTRTKTIVQPAMAAAAQRLGPELQTLADHQLASGGKYVRACLALLSASAAGADQLVGLDGALAIELVHNFSLIHDDIMDNDLTRRHQPTMWAKYGVGPAILIGDALSALAFQLLLDENSSERVLASRCLAEAVQAMILGQAQDISSEDQLFLSVEECLRMEAGKTGALLACAASLGAILAGADDAVVAALSQYGHHLGLAFQATDDMLGVWGEESVTGKPVGNDLRLRKKTLPISIAYAKGFDIFGEVGSTGTEDLTDPQVAAAMVLLDDCGARYETLELAENELRAAISVLDQVPLVSSARAELEVIARYVIARDK
jgi:geranylgeranyl diphosphate synthase type I